MSEEEMLKRKYTRPYEKRIADLEKENAELKLKLEALEGQTPWKDIKDKSELIKENAELKEELKDANEKVVNLACNQNKDLKRKINKAKELLKKVVTDFHNMDCVTVHIDKTIAEAEQFLEDSEVEK
jgi:small-conductance mechanosensitive channel